jgi:hypothetical protein
MLGIVTLVIGIATWLLLMPWVPAIAATTLKRFHLSTGSFAAWAVQFPIPAMYNFANRYEVHESAEALSDDSSHASRRMLNHFPARIFTFADGRFMYLRDGDDRWLTIESSYRGQTLQSRFHAEPREGWGYRLHRLDSTEPTDE